MVSSLPDDLPCRVQDVGIEGRSIVCVCDANYCDTITREEPAPGTFVVYTSTDVSLTQLCILYASISFLQLYYYFLSFEITDAEIAVVY